MEFCVSRVCRPWERSGSETALLKCTAGADFLDDDPPAAHAEGLPCLSRAIAFYVTLVGKG